MRARKGLPGVVYYVGCPGQNRVKIGWTQDLAVRLAALGDRGFLHGFPASPMVYATEPGTMETETQRHRQFRIARIGRSEMYHLHPALASHIAGLAIR